MQDKEEVFDEYVAPILVDLMETVKQLGIPMICLFQLNDGPNAGEISQGAACEPLFAEVQHVLPDSRLAALEPYIKSIATKSI